MKFAERRRTLSEEGFLARLVNMSVGLSAFVALYLVTALAAVALAQRANAEAVP